MLDIREIEYWISRYKLDDYVTLSALYSNRDKLPGVQAAQFLPQPQIAAYFEEASPIKQSAGSVWGQ